MEAIRAVVNGELSLKQAFDQTFADEPDSKAVVELAFRQCLRAFIKEQKPFSECTKLIDIAIDGCKNGVSFIITPHVLLEDFCEIITLQECEAIFTFLEQRINVWASEPFSTFPSSFQRLLRVCNALKRRLSKPLNTEFCGRILIFLASIVPLTDKSGLNALSNFNTVNVTVFDQDVKDSAITDLNGSLIDVGIYKKLWTLQAFCVQPNIIYSKDQWPSFQACTTAILDVFESYALEDLGDAEYPMVSGDEENNVYFAKYLTSPSLLQLQLADGKFRRQVLVQLLIVLQYLKTPTKFKKEQQVLNFIQLEWTGTLSERIWKIARKIPPQGEKFVTLVQYLLQREEKWIAWKNNSCPNYEMQPFKRAAEAEAAHPVSSRRKIDMGSVEMTRLWNLPVESGTDAIIKSPNLIDFFRPVLEQMDPENCVEEEYWSVNDATYCWRSLRLLAKTRITLLQESGAGAQKTLPEFLKQTIKTVMTEEDTTIPEAVVEGEADAQPTESQPAEAQPAQVTDAPPAEPTS